MWAPDLAGRNPVRYLAIVQALADDIARGGLRPGERLPTHRALAWRLGVNTSTVSHAYREAVRRHLVSGEVGRGRVAQIRGVSAATPALSGVQVTRTEIGRSSSSIRLSAWTALLHGSAVESGEAIE